MSRLGIDEPRYEPFTVRSSATRLTAGMLKDWDGCGRPTVTGGFAPARTAPRSADNPTPPRPKTTALRPGRSWAVFTTAPTPVSTAQPNSAAISGGSDGSIFTADRADTTA